MSRGSFDLNFSNNQWSINLWQRRQEHKMRKRQSCQQLLLGNLDSCMQINETRTQPHTMHKKRLKMAEKFKYKIRHHQTLEENIGKTFSDINLMNIFSGQPPKTKKKKTKIKQWDLMKLTSFCTAKKTIKKKKTETKRQFTE